jgi:endoglucanase
MVYFLSKGMNVFRIPFRWERIQPRPFDDLESADMDQLDKAIAFATSNGAFVILDPHNYGRYKGQLIGSEATPVAAFADLWRRLSERYRGNQRVIFGLMNEPFGMPPLNWLSTANTTIAAIRATGATNLILVPGSHHSSAHNWFKPKDGPSNAMVMGGVRDRANNFAIEIHQYFDGDLSGTRSHCPDPDIGVRVLAPVTQWLRERNLRGFLGEFGASAEPGCLEAIDNTLQLLNQKSDSWMGWAWWSAGPRWPKDYPFLIEPSAGRDKPQMSVLMRYLRGTAPN